MLESNSTSFGVGNESLMCLQRSRCVWTIQNTPDPVERKPSEYISIAMGGSESARGSSLAFSKQDRKCRHNPYRVCLKEDGEAGEH